MGAGVVRAEQSSFATASSTSHTHYHSQHHSRTRGASHTSSNFTSSANVSSNGAGNMKCEGCTNTFTLFRRKKICGACGRHFCSRCLQEDRQKSKASARQCSKCAILASGHFTRSEIALWRIKDLRCFLDHNNVATSTCREKQDLVDLLVHHFKKSGAESSMEDRVSSSAERVASAQTSPATAAASPAQPSTLSGWEEQSEPWGGRAQEEGQERGRTEEQEGSGLSAQDQDDRSVPVDMLAAMGVGGNMDSSQTEPEHPSFLPASSTDPEPPLQNSPSVQAPESSEIRQPPQSTGQEEFQASQPRRSNRLHLEDLRDADSIEDLTIKQLKEILVNNFVNFRGCCEKWELTDRVRRLWQAKQENRGKDVKTLDLDHPDLCKVCMDAVVDCVLLECGHMVTCTHCGKQLTECPICRQCIIRAVHIFRS